MAGSEEQNFILDAAAPTLGGQIWLCNFPPISEARALATSHFRENLQQGMSCWKLSLFLRACCTELSYSSATESRLGRLFDASDSSVLSEPSSTFSQKVKLISPPAANHVSCCPRYPQAREAPLALLLSRQRPLQKFADRAVTRNGDFTQHPLYWN